MPGPNTGKDNWFYKLIHSGDEWGRRKGDELAGKPPARKEGEVVDLDAPDPMVEYEEKRRARGRDIASAIEALKSATRPAAQSAYDYRPGFTQPMIDAGHGDWDHGAGPPRPFTKEDAAALAAQSASGAHKFETQKYDIRRLEDRAAAQGLDVQFSPGKVEKAEDDQKRQELDELDAQQVRGQRVYQEDPSAETVRKAMEALKRKKEEYDRLTSGH